MKALKTMRQLSTAYHSQTDKQIERINQEVETFLQHYINYQQNDWTEWLVATEFSYNNKKLLQISYSLVVILELSGVLEVQYKEIMMSSINKNN